MEALVKEAFEAVKSVVYGKRINPDAPLDTQLSNAGAQCESFLRRPSQSSGAGAVSSSSSPAYPMDGMLQKSPKDHSTTFKKWKSYRFAFVPRSSQGHHRLDFWEPTADMSSKPKGSIGLQNCVKVCPVGVFKKFQHTFEVNCSPERVYLFVATSEDEMNRWVNVIGSHLFAGNGP